MRNSAFVFMTISALLLSACGKVDMHSKHQMSETEALDTLSELPAEEGGRTLRGRTSNLSLAGLNQLIIELVRSGKVKLPANFRGATDGTPDLTQLTNLLTLLSSGQANSIIGLANGLINMNGGDIGGTTGGLASIMALLQTIAPLIATIAPQYAMIIQAIVTILPLVMTFISIFKKPKSAAVYYFVPTFS